MTTISEVLKKFKKNGYTVEFNLTDTCLICRGSALKLYPDEFTVDKHCAFEGILDPEDEVVVYAISSKKRHVMGTLINVYGTYTDNIPDEMLKALDGNIYLKAVKRTEDTKEVDFIRNSPLSYSESGIPNKAMTIMDLPTFQKQIKQKQTWKNKDRHAITIFKNKVTRLVLVALQAEAELKTHRAVHLISLQVLEGTLKIGTEQEFTHLGAGQIIVFPVGIPHSLLAREESVFLLTLAEKKQYPDTGNGKPPAIQGTP
jgi:quercetin dioxygenase-like cupin family protein